MKLQNYQTEQKIMYLEVDIQGLTPTMIYLFSSISLSCSIGCSYLRFHFIHTMNKSKTWRERGGGRELKIGRRLVRERERIKC